MAKVTGEWKHWATLLKGLSQNHPGQILAGSTPALGCHLAHSEFTEQKEKINGHSATKLEGGPTLWESGDAAILSMVPSKPTQAESISDYTVLDCCAVCDLRQRAAVSVIKAIERKLWPYVQTDNCCLPLRYKCYYCTLKDILLSWLLL